MPVSGLLKPHEEIEIRLKAAPAEHQQPIALSPEPGQIVMTRVEGTVVVMRNTTDKYVPFTVIIVPKSAVALAMVPWRDVGKGVMDTVKRVRERFAKKPKGT